MAGEARINNVSWNDYVALSLLVLGIVLYSIRKEWQADKSDLLVRAEDAMCSLLARIGSWNRRPLPSYDDPTSNFATVEADDEPRVYQRRKKL